MGSCWSAFRACEGWRCISLGDKGLLFRIILHNCRQERSAKRIELRLQFRTRSSPWDSVARAVLLLSPLRICRACGSLTYASAGVNPCAITSCNGPDWTLGRKANGLGAEGFHKPFPFAPHLSNHVGLQKASRQDLLFPTSLAQLQPFPSDPLLPSFNLRLDDSSTQRLRATAGSSSSPSHLQLPAPELVPALVQAQGRWMPVAQTRPAVYPFPTPLYKRQDLPSETTSDSDGELGFCSVRLRWEGLVARWIRFGWL